MELSSRSESVVAAKFCAEQGTKASSGCARVTERLDDAVPRALEGYDGEGLEPDLGRLELDVQTRGDLLVRPEVQVSFGRKERERQWVSRHEESERRVNSLPADCPSLTKISLTMRSTTSWTLTM